ncbi:uncharacterized protein [Lolium perenne]|uniref:uncharacterized protein isoform X1 n=1 Tax=Lolium perenne TaxID=4522 RepID=UPI0021F6868D|nr:uncharacterized protein LOC127337155 isoform X3 [Lolium perenne]
MMAKAVPARMEEMLRKTRHQTMNGWLLTDCWHRAEMASVEYFNLVDLWEKYHKWSVYGGSCVADPRCFGEDYSMDFWSDDEDKEKMSRSHVFFEVLLMEGSPHMHKGRIWKTMREAWDRLISTIHRWAILCKTALEVTLQQYIRDMEHKREELLQIARH